MLLWDVFCQVVDNYGDAGFCWRLASDLAARGQQVRLWIDDAAPLAWLGAPAANGGSDGQGGGITVLDWQRARSPQALAGLRRPDVLVEAFGCEIPQGYLQALQALAQAQAEDEAGHVHHHAPAQPWPLWLNVEYLSAEPYVERMHGLPSPVMAGAAAGQTRWFIYPGFTAATAGLLRGPHLGAARRAHDALAWRRALLPAHAQGEAGGSALWISLFAYEPACLPAWLQQWAHGAAPVHLVAAAGRSQDWLIQCWRALGWPEPPQTSAASDPQGVLTHGALRVHRLPFVTQAAFDRMLWSCDLNIVRGEESMVRALWAAVPLLWQIYPQDDGAHEAKLRAWLDRLGIAGDWCSANLAINALQAGVDGQEDAPTPEQVAHWRGAAGQMATRLAELPDLTSSLLDWAARHRRPITPP